MGPDLDAGKKPVSESTIKKSRREHYFQISTKAFKNLARVSQFKDDLDKFEEVFWI